MAEILILGAGRSSPVLIEALTGIAVQRGWKVVVVDRTEILNDKLSAVPEACEPVAMNVQDAEARRERIRAADLVISMLPVSLHMSVARDCLDLGRSLITPSYVTREMQELDGAVKEKGLIFLNEMGVDPGIDHLSAMEVIDRIRAKGGQMTRFESFTGGLLAPGSEGGNPWKYKFSWNPRNVVMAGQGGAAKFVQNSTYKYIPYHRLFRRTEYVDIEGYGRFEGYANRDSLYYRRIYGLMDIRTIYRGTLRRPGFCRAWDVFVQLGCTDDSYVMEGSEKMTYRDFINSFLGFNPYDIVELKLMHNMKIDQDDELMEKLQWLGIFEKKPVELKNATPAQILQKILEEKWTMGPDDRDMIVMWHKFEYVLDGKPKGQDAFMVCTGDDQRHTAMAKAVGLPIAIAADLILRNKITAKGVVIPVSREFYGPILAELERYDISFSHKEAPIVDR